MLRIVSKPEDFTPIKEGLVFVVEADEKCDLDEDNSGICTDALIRPVGSSARLSARKGISEGTPPSISWSSMESQASLRSVQARRKPWQTSCSKRVEGVGDS